MPALSDFDFQARSKSDGSGNWTYKPEDGLVAAFGLPAQPYAGSNVAEAGVANGISTTTPISILPFRGYRLIWNEYYRDQNVDDELPINTASDGRVDFAGWEDSGFKASVFGDLLSRLSASDEREDHRKSNP